MMSWVEMVIFLAIFRPSNLSTRVLTAVSPISSVNTFTVLNDGKTYLEMLMSLTPMIFTRPGTGIPSSNRALSAPTARESFAAKKAVGRFSPCS